MSSDLSNPESNPELSPDHSTPGPRVAIIKIEEIENFSQRTLEYETMDRHVLQSLDYAVLKMALYTWAANGFLASYRAYEFPILAKDEINDTIRCSDGNLRNIWDYISFILNSSIEDFIQSYEVNLSGISLSYSIQKNPYILLIHVTKQ
jgi:hypothetical protein